MPFTFYVSRFSWMGATTRQGALLVNGVGSIIRAKGHFLRNLGAYADACKSTKVKELLIGWRTGGYGKIANRTITLLFTTANL